MAAALAVATAALVRLLVPVGVDTAGQLYETLRWLHGGFQFWDNYWYDGRYSLIDYSLLYYPIANLAGQLPTILAVLAASAYLFERLVFDRFGVSSPWPARAFAVTTSIGVWISGEYPFALGMALGLLALVLCDQRRVTLATAATLATLLASPLAFLLLMLSLVGITVGVGSRGRLLHPGLIIGLALCALLGVGVQLAFPAGGDFPFNFWALFQVLALSACAFAVSARLRGVGVIRGVFAAMSIAAVAAYVIPSPVGGNATRLIDYVGGPLIWILLARQLDERRIRRAAAIMIGAVVLGGQLAPNVVSASMALNTPSAQARFWTGAIAFLHAHSNPSFRVESVDSAGHWDAYYLPAAGIPIVRGWFRQDDFPGNELLYDPALSSARYDRWLRSNGVHYVVLPNGSLDYSATAEAQVLRSGRSGLHVVYRDRNVAIFALLNPTPLLTAPPGRHAAVLGFGHVSMAVRLSGPGRYRLAITYTPYWEVSPQGSACIAKSAQGFSEIVDARAGNITLRFGPTLMQILGGAAPACRAQAPAAAS